MFTSMTAKEQRVERMRKWREEESRQIERTKAELAEEYGLERNAKFDKAWDIAWRLGHSSGLMEVKGYFDDLVDLILP